MSEDNVFSRWKREASGSSNVVGPLFTKADVIGEASSSSSQSISVQSNIPMDMLQHQQQLDLQKISHISKINSIAKLTAFEGISQMPEKDRLRKVQQIVEAGIGDHAKQQILQILDKISLLKPPERLLLYLRMPGGTPETDPLRQPQNPLGTRSEINHTINWVRSHLEHDPKVSIPKQDVYNDYEAYCERVDIKPLSTADFGKVMKQVFPEIRPRRLGTRGHSRYCYAAMRKATKLDSPRLPSLGTEENTPDYGTTDEDSWKIIKLWVESLLNSSFSCLKDLATHITKHNLNSPASNSSRLLLQKRLLQKDNKEKRKFNESGPLKKRRKKKRRNSSSSESNLQTQVPSEVSLDGSTKCIKSEIVESCQNKSQVQPPVTGQIQSQQTLPMNLTADQDNVRKIQGTNLTCDNNLVVGCTAAKSLVVQNIPSIPDAMATNSNCNIPAPTSPNLIKLELESIKEEISDEYNPNIFCKKVRQAQQAKGLWSPANNVSVPIVQQTPLLPPPVQENIVHEFSRPANTILGPPVHIDSMPQPSICPPFKRLTAMCSGDSDNRVQSGLKSHSGNLPARVRKLRNMHKQETLNEMNSHTTATGEQGTEKDVLPENLGIPRERVISICNMDKHELDDYLNEDENSQDQEAELLQYFQQEEAGNIKVEEEANANQNQQPSNFPVLENYQLYGCPKSDRKGTINADGDEITQLRFYLHQNLQNSNGTNSNTNNKNMYGPQTMETSTSEDTGNFNNLYSEGSASASLALMSQRHLSVVPEDPINLRCCSGNLPTNNHGPSNNSALRGPRRKINLNARSCVPNSPNTRRKHFSFVPISPNMNTNHSHNNTVDYSPFVSPRSTPIVRKPPLNKQNSLPISDLNQVAENPPVPSHGSSTTFQNILSASAPPSPSLVQQRFRFATSTTTGTSQNIPLSNTSEQFNQLQSVNVQNRNQGLGMDGNPESRSQSVPLHCRNSPGFNHSNNFPGFSSTCSSVRQTPVPPDFNDFNDPTILDIFSDASQTQAVKLESTEMASSLLVDADIASTESEIGMSDLLTGDFVSKSTASVNNISRSVPSTPLPISGYKCSNVTLNAQDTDKTNKIYDMSKSVPTTPVAMNVGPFRYSPEVNRDFLINGNSVESTKKSSFYSSQQSQQPLSQGNTNDSVRDKVVTTSLSEGIDELSNFGVVSESISIIGSDLLNNI